MASALCRLVGEAEDSRAGRLRVDGFHSLLIDPFSKRRFPVPKTIGLTISLHSSRSLLCRRDLTRTLLPSAMSLPCANTRCDHPELDSQAKEEVLLMAVYVLVSGGWLGGWCWQRVVRRLRDEGHDAYPVTLTDLGAGAPGKPRS